MGSISYQHSRSIDELKSVISSMISEGSDPRKFRRGLAETYSVSVEIVDGIIGGHEVPSEEEMRFRYVVHCESYDVRRESTEMDRMHDER